MIFGNFPAGKKISVNLGKINRPRNFRVIDKICKTDGKINRICKIDTILVELICQIDMQNKQIQCFLAHFLARVVY